MSLSATWYKCDDGKTYKDPVWRGSWWFICSDDEDPLELVVMKPKGLQPMEALQYAKQALAEAGFDAEIVQGSYSGSSARVFDGKPKPAFRFFIRLNSSPPRPT